MTNPRIDIEATLFCGQSFAWSKEGDTYQAAVGGRLIAFDEHTLPGLLETDQALAHYFDTSFDYASAEEYLSSIDPHLKRCIERYRGIRILNQDPWETTISFILSQTNSIARIRGLYRALGSAYGQKLGPGVFSFPRPDELRGIEEADLRALGVGFRAPYIIDAVKKSHILEEVARLDDPDALKALMAIDGIGPKVGSCILLFSYGRKRAFPMDVWIKRIMAEHYESEQPSRFSPYEGLAQQYLFHYHRTNGGGS